jgi:CRISPR-associated protein Csx17
LPGCASRPLIGYLKALGVLRVTGRQTDPTARGRWRNGVFELRSSLGADELEAFLGGRYVPAPVLSPWNGGSGFYRKGNATAVENLERIEATTAERLRPYRELIGATRATLADLDITEKPDGAAKERLIRRLRRTWPDDAVEWLDAAVVIAGSEVRFPPLLGSGGNDGRYDFSSNYMEALGETLLDESKRSAELLAGSLRDTRPRLTKRGLAHFSRDASPTNSPYGEAESLGNPWDLILAMEGSLLLTAGAARRHGSDLRGGLVAPFAVRPTSAGYGSAVKGESGRAELWLPLWEGWAGYGEVSVLAREARATVGGARPRQATTGLDLARACGELGVVRGIASFERYSILERAGQSSLAVPAGRVAVKTRPGRAVAALQSLDGWLRSALGFAAGERCPQIPKLAIRHLERAVFEMAARGEATDGCAVLETLGDVEASLARSSASIEAMRPLARVPAAAWIEAADDGSHEFAVAAAIASLGESARRSANGGGRGHGPPALRDYLHGTRRSERGTAFDPERRHAVAGGDPVAILAALHARRHLDAARLPVERAGEGERGDGPALQPSSPLGFQWGSWVSLESARLFMAGALDEGRVLALLRGLALLDHSRSAPSSKPSPRSSPSPPQPALELLSLAWHPVRNGKDPRAKRSGNAFSLGARPGWAARLVAGATRSVVDDAILRLGMAGLPPKLACEDLLIEPGAEHELGRRLGAALLLRFGGRDINRIANAQLSSTDNHETKESR